MSAVGDLRLFFALRSMMFLALTSHGRPRHSDQSPVFLEACVLMCTDGPNHLDEDLVQANISPDSTKSLRVRQAAIPRRQAAARGAAELEGARLRTRGRHLAGPRLAHGTGMGTGPEDKEDTDRVRSRAGLRQRQGQGQGQGQGL